MMGRYVRVSGGANTVGSDDMSDGAIGIARAFDDDLALYGASTFMMAPFGSYHPAVCNFLIGDGAVRAFPVTTPPRILACLGTVNDGNSVAMP